MYKNTHVYYLCLWLQVASLDSLTSLVNNDLTIPVLLGIFNFMLGIIDAMYKLHEEEKWTFYLQTQNCNALDLRDKFQVS